MPPEQNQSLSSQEKMFSDSQNADAPHPAPQIIAHRGYKGKYAENSMSAFEGAVRVESNAVETDLALSSDGVVVISHDQSLKRCFGVNKSISRCDWKYLQTVTMLQEPHEPVPRLSDLLKYLAQPENEQIWAFLDIKLNNNPIAIIPQIAKTIASVPHAPHKPWHTRLILGCWASSFVPQIITHLPDFSMALVCFDLHAARRFFPLSNLVAYNVNQQVLMGPLGRGFLEDAKKAGKKVFVWTVNSESAMRWCIRKNVDGVVTDHPDSCRQLVKTEGPATTPGSDMEITLSDKAGILKISLLVVLFGWIFRLKFLPRVKVEGKSTVETK